MFFGSGPSLCLGPGVSFPLQWGGGYFLQGVGTVQESSCHHGYFPRQGCVIRWFWANG